MTDTPNAPRERIDLPGGWYFAPSTWGMRGLFGPGGKSYGAWTNADARAFAAALRAAAKADGEEVDAGPSNKGTFACPICGQDTPHHHTSKVVQAYENSLSRRGPLGAAKAEEAGS